MADSIKSRTEMILLGMGLVLVANVFILVEMNIAKNRAESTINYG